MRRLYKKKKQMGIIYFLIIGCIFFQNSLIGFSKNWNEPFGAIMEAEKTVESAAKLSDQTLYAKSAVLMDGKSGRVLYGKNPDEIMAMASTTKIMTCIIALEYGNKEDIYTVSSYASSQPKVKLGAMTGEQYRMKDLLYSLMLESHNDAAVIIAEGVAGSVEAFAALMNQKAQELGCMNTCFVTPNGLDAQGHHTTAAELARIMKYCLLESSKKEEFLKITRTVSYTFSDVKQKRSISCQNHNTLLSMMDGAVSGKTGFTGNAGYCYVGAVERDGKFLIVALLACGWPNNRNYKWSDTKLLMEYGFSNYEYKDIYEISNLADVPVINGQAENVALRVEDGTKQLNYLMKDGETVHIRKKLPSQLTAPVDAKTAVGVIEYYIDEEKIKEYFIYPKESVKAIDFRWCLEQVKQLFFLYANLGNESNFDL